MNLIDPFTEFIDSIYYPGYAQQMAKDDPVKYSFEYNEFASQF